MDKLLGRQIQAFHWRDQVVFAVNFNGNQKQTSQMCSHSTLELGFV